MIAKEHFHGSDLEKIEQTFHIKKEDITSFSANVNPLGISPKMKEHLKHHIDCITTYPDREYTSLRQSIGRYVNTDYSHILVGNGATELISLFINFHKPKKAILLAPTYSEYQREIERSGGNCSFYFLKEEQNFSLNIEHFKQCLDHTVDLVIICNPNNPTSTALTTNQMEEIVKHCEQHQIFVLVDETYIEFTDEMLYSSVPLVNQYHNLVILRGISKFFGSPGLRLGYAICGNQKLLSYVKKEQNPWTINSLASLAGEVMFSDKEFQQQTKQYIKDQRLSICHQLSSIPSLSFIPPVANFVLCNITDKKITANELFEICIQKGLMIRDCATFEGLSPYFFRFCFMEQEKNNQLLQIITDVFS